MKFCERPFRYLYVGWRWFSTCCIAWLDKEARITPSDRQPEDPWSAWNHPKIVALRRRILDGDFGFCAGCPRVISNGPDDQCQPWYAPEMLTGPDELYVANDDACNLTCWKCRRRAVADHADWEARLLQLRGFASAFLPGASWISLSHVGDPFASKAHRAFLFEIDADMWPGVKIEIFTNGQLLPACWSRLAAIHERIRRVKISVDAATPGTYRKIRGADWDRLLDAVLTVRRHCVPEIELNFCVQASNFRELPAFVEWASHYGATRIVVNMLRRSWMPDALYNKENVALPNHPDHQEFLSILEKDWRRHPLLFAPTLDRRYWRVYQ